MSVIVAEKDGNLCFSVRAIPRASKTEVAGELDGALKLRIASPPVKGAANAEVVRFLAKKFAVSRSDVEIVSGQNSKNKRIMIRNLSQSKFEEKIG